jgi:hypothetical protein
MEFLDISSLGATYQYDVEIERKFNPNNKRDFSYANPSQKNPGKGVPNSHDKGKSKDG